MVAFCSQVGVCVTTSKGQRPLLHLSEKQLHDDSLYHQRTPAGLVTNITQRYHCHCVQEETT